MQLRLDTLTKLLTESFSAQPSPLSNIHLVSLRPFALGIHKRIE